MRILFDSKNEKYKKPFGAIKTGQVGYFNILVPLTCTARKVFLLLEKDGGTRQKFELTKGAYENGYESFSGDIKIENEGLYFYWFYIKKSDGGFSLFKQGYNDTNMEEGHKWQLTCYDKNYSAPDWAKGAVIYQIFPDRFNKSGEVDLSGKLTPFRIHENLNDIPDNRPDSEGNWNTDFFGGNLHGIIEKLPYIKDLGADIIYLNPIVKAFSNHRYDTADYMAVDPMLGSNEDFKSLCDHAHELGIRIIIDGVFSHTGNRSIYFESAVNEKNSPYLDWYDFKQFPNDYTAWWRVKTLPQIKKGHPGFIKFITEEVIPFWIKSGADGIRLDVADELTDGFICEISSSAKEIKKDALIMGEVWEDASNKISYGERRNYLFGHELDSVMNYPFLNAIKGLIKGDKSADDFKEEIMTIVENYPPEILCCCMNMLSTHDTARIYNVVSNKVRIAAFLQFMLPGAPSIYYGDEIGMEGERDPFNRGYFKWDRVDCDLHKFFKKLCRLKHELIDLKDENIRFENEKGVLIFYRNNLKIIVNLTNNPFESGGEIVFGENYAGGTILQNGFGIIK
ncbi:MAG: glycoside hydrolase family 13 protein [Monoglobales bacterium]